MKHNSWYHEPFIRSIIVTGFSCVFTFTIGIAVVVTGNTNGWISWDTVLATGVFVFILHTVYDLYFKIYFPSAELEHQVIFRLKCLKLKLINKKHIVFLPYTLYTKEIIDWGNESFGYTPIVLRSRFFEQICVGCQTDDDTVLMKIRFGGS